MSFQTVVLVVVMVVSSWYRTIITAVIYSYIYKCAIIQLKLVNTMYSLKFDQYI